MTTNQYWINYLVLSCGNVHNIPCTDSLNWKEVTKTVNKIKQRGDTVAVFVYDGSSKLVYHEIFVDFCGQKVHQEPFAMAEPGSEGKVGPNYMLDDFDEHFRIVEEEE